MRPLRRVIWPLCKVCRDRGFVESEETVRQGDPRWSPMLFGAYGGRQFVINREPCPRGCGAREFTALGWHRIPGRGMVCTVSNMEAELDEPASLRGELVRVDGEVFRVTGVETFRIVRPYPKSFNFGLLVKPMVTSS